MSPLEAQPCIDAAGSTTGQPWRSPDYTRYHSLNSTEVPPLPGRLPRRPKGLARQVWPRAPRASEDEPFLAVIAGALGSWFPAAGDA